MRNLFILGACLSMSLLATAQKEVVKDVEHLLKGSTPDYATALKNIQPALTDASTSGLQEAWYLAGKAGDGVYEQIYLKEQISPGSATDAEKKAAGDALLNSVNYYRKALKLPDEKGKLPGKKNKEILKTLGSLYPQLSNAGIFLYNSQDYKGAHKAFDEFASFVSDPSFVDAKGKYQGPKALPDSVINYYQLLNARACLIDKNNEDAYKILKSLSDANYNDIDVYTFGVMVGNFLEKPEIINEFANKGYQLYGTKDVSFIGEMINQYMDKNDYKKCHELIDEALANVPQENVQIRSQLYDILGIVYEREENPAEAEKCFTLATTADPNYAKGYYNKARILYNTAIKADENSDSRTQSGDVTKELLEAAELFKKAYSMDSSLKQVPSILYRIYYRLGAGYEDDAAEWEGR